MSVNRRSTAYTFIIQGKEEYELLLVSVALAMGRGIGSKP